MSKRSAQKFEAEEVTDITARADHRAAAAMARYTVEAADQVRRAAMSDLLDLGGELRSTTTSSAEYESCDDADAAPDGGASVASGASRAQALRYRPRDELLQRINRKMREIRDANKRMRLATEEMNARMDHMSTRLNHIETSVSDMRDYEEAAVPERRAILALLHAGGAHVAPPAAPSAIAAGAGAAAEAREPGTTAAAADVAEPQATSQTPQGDLEPADWRWWKARWEASGNGRGRPSVGL